MYLFTWAPYYQGLEIYSHTLVWFAQGQIFESHTADVEEMNEFTH